MYILGIDPWFRKLWYAIIDSDLNIIDWGILLSEKHTVKTDTSHNIQIHTNHNPNRLRVHNIYNYFLQMSKDHKIDRVVIEKLFFMDSNRDNAERVYAVRWILINLFMSLWIEVLEFTPIQVKKYITWNGKAGKLLVQKIIQNIYQLDEMPEFNDTADALWLAYIGTKF